MRNNFDRINWHQILFEGGQLRAHRQRFLEPRWLPLSYYGKDQPPPSPPGPLTAKEERTLFMQYRRTGDAKIKERLMRQYLCWAFKLANKYKGPRLNVDEAVSAANLGLSSAIETFKPGRNTKFIVYSYTVIYRHLVEALVATYPITVSTHMRKKFKAIEKDATKAAEQAADGNPASLDEVFERLGSASDFNITLLTERQEDAPFMPCEIDTPDTATASSLLSDEVKHAVKTKLTPIERAAVVGRHYTDPVRTFDQIGRKIGQPKNKVRAAYASAIVKLKEYLT